VGDKMEQINELKELEEKILSYMHKKERVLDEVEISSSELAVALGVSRSTLYRYINTLIDNKFILAQQKQRDKVYILTNQAREYIERTKISYFNDDDIKALNYEDNKSLKKSIETVTVLKGEVQAVKTQIDDDRTKFKSDLEDMKKDINKKIDSFYGRIGEILALIITAIAMIVFNIQIIGSVEIDFSEPVGAFKTIMAIDLPFMILFVLFITAFHFIIGKDFNTSEGWVRVVLSILLRTLPMLIVIGVCYGLLVLL
jgi:DNA-binding PadR family transcriptional regulator